MTYESAFPLIVTTKIDSKTGGPTEQEIYPGMSLRDWFAGQALTAAGTWSPLPLSQGHLYGKKEDAEARAAWAYLIADAMLAARKE